MVYPPPSIHHPNNTTHSPTHSLARSRDWLTDWLWQAHSPSKIYLPLRSTTHSVIHPSIDISPLSPCKKHLSRQTNTPWRDNSTPDHAELKIGYTQPLSPRRVDRGSMRWTRGWQSRVLEQQPLQTREIRTEWRKNKRANKQHRDADRQIDPIEQIRTNKTWQNDGERNDERS